MMKLTNEYTLLHVAAGIIAYYWGLPLIGWLIVHALFEYIENTKIGMNLINNYIPTWPGGKQTKETFFQSMVSDNFFAVVGWLIASFVDKGFKFSIEKRKGDTKFKKIST